MLKKSILLFIAFNLTACGTSWEKTRPKMTGLEQILIATAADRASSQLSSNPESEEAEPILDSGLGKSFLYTKGFEQDIDRYKYALHSVRRELTDMGVILVDNVEEADTIIEVGASALSVDNTHFLFGLPSMGMPIPFAGQLDMPEIAIYKSEKNRSIAKFSVSLRDAKTGEPKSHSFTSVGTAWTKDWTVLLLIEFSSNDLDMPEVYDSAAWN